MKRFQLGLAAWPQKILIGLVQGYRWFLSPWLGSACRFTPTCSVYALEALQTHGAGQGSYLTLKRLVRCHPWCAGGHDPVPAAKPAPQVSEPKLFSSLVSEKTSP
jgi:uncharacterized protein